MLLVIIAKSQEVQEKGSDAGATRAFLSQAEIARLFFYEFALHAGRMSGPTWTEIQEKPSIEKEYVRETIYMPSGHSNRKVRQWSMKIDVMYNVQPVDTMKQLKP